MRQLPTEYETVLLTYDAVIRSGPYGMEKSTQTVTRKAFYTKSDGYYDDKDRWIETPNGYFHVPQYWRRFNGVLMPHTFYSYGRVLPEDIIKWEVHS